LPAEERATLTLPEFEADTLLVLYSTPETVTLMYIAPEQFRTFVREVAAPDSADLSVHLPTMVASDVATMQTAIQRFGFQEFSVNGYKTDDILARLQGKS
jgi:methylmalonyl-CoA mutase